MPGFYFGKLNSRVNSNTGDGKSGSTDVMKNARLALAVIVLANLILATAMYLSFGWYFIRGYNEVVNFVVFTFVFAQAALNLLLAAPIVLVRQWRRTNGGRTAMVSFAASAGVVLLSLWFAPILGRFANQNLWLKTPLVKAASYGDASLVITLLERGDDPNTKALHQSRTALHYMAAHGELEAVEMLLAKGADPNAREGYTLRTPLHWAIRGHVNLAVVKLLTAHGADRTLKDWEGKTPVEYTRGIPNPLRLQLLNAMGRGDLPSEDMERAIPLPLE